MVGHACVFVVALACAYSYPITGTFPEVGLVGRFGAGVVLAEVQLLLMLLVLGDPVVSHGDAKPSVRSRIASWGVLALLFAAAPWLLCPIGMFVIPILVAQLEDRRLTRFPPSGSLRVRPFQFSIRQLVVVMCGVGLLFGLAQTSPTGGLHDGSPANTLRLALGLMGSALIALTVGILVMTIPLASAWAVLSPGRVLPRLSTCVLSWILGAALLWHLHDGWLLDGLAIVGANVVFLLASLGVLRMLGVRFIEVSTIGNFVLREEE